MGKKQPNTNTGVTLLKISCLTILAIMNLIGIYWGKQGLTMFGSIILFSIVLFIIFIDEHRGGG